MDYKTPEVTDHGDLVEITAASGIALTEDGAGKSITADVGPISLTLQVLP